jgi:hypothetical protein
MPTESLETMSIEFLLFKLPSYSCTGGMSSTGLTPAEQAEQEDRKLLSECNQKIQEVMQLLSEGNTQSTVKQRVSDAKNRIGAPHKEGRGMVFHPYKGKRTPVTQEASDQLVLGEALELMLTLSEHTADLQKDILRLGKKRVAILERLLKHRK